MRVYTIHYKPGSPSPDRDALLVKEGFCWPAALFSLLWALWHRLWLVAGLVFAADFVLDLVLMLSGADGATRFVCVAALHVFIGYEANDWRRARLSRTGYREAGLVAAPNADAALRRFFDLNPDAIAHGRGATL
jgi:hypothetical protein